MGKLKISKFAIRWNSLYLWVNPFVKSIDTKRALKLNVKLIYTFFKCNIRRLYRWVFNIKAKPLSKEEQKEIEKMLRGFVEDVKPMIDKIHTEAEYKRTVEE